MGQVGKVTCTQGSNKSQPPPPQMLPVSPARPSGESYAHLTQFILTAVAREDPEAQRGCRLAPGTQLGRSKIGI